MQAVLSILEVAVIPASKAAVELLMHCMNLLHWKIAVEVLTTLGPTL